MKLPLCSVIHPLTSFLRPNIFLSTLFSNPVRLCSFPNVRDQLSHPYKAKGKIILPYVIICVFQIANVKTDDCGLNCSRHSSNLISPLFHCAGRFFVDVVPNYSNFALYIYIPIPVAMRSKAWVFGRSLTRIVGSNADPSGRAA
jgi:hypothetical protein